jgi:hypothetical protein
MRMPWGREAEDLVPLLVDSEWPSLQSLDLFWWHLNLSAAGQERILNAPFLRQLRELGWTVERESGARSLQRLAERGPFPYLERIDMLGLRGNRWNTFKPGNQTESGSSFPALRSLDFGDQFIGDDELRFLQQQPWLSNLRHLGMYRPAEQGVTRLGDFFKEADLKSLTALEIWFFRHWTVLKELADSGLLSQLQYLNVMDSVDSSTLRLLTENPQTGQLRFLGLAQSDLSVEDIDRILKSPHLKNLVYLDVDCPSWEYAANKPVENLKAVKTLLFTSAPPGLAAFQFVPIRGVERLREKFFVNYWYRDFDSRI